MSSSIAQSDQQRPSSGGTLNNPESGFAQIKAALTAAVRKNPSKLRQFDCLFAGRAVRVRTVGQKLGQTTARSLAHLLTPPGQTPQPLLTIDLWDGAETAIPWQMMAQENGRGIDYWFATSADQRYIVMERQRELTWFDRRAAHVVGWITDAEQFNLAEQARVAYFPVVLWLHDLDLQVAHAGLVAENGNGLFFAGETGQGKSTAALACLTGGLDFLSDDHVWIESTPGGVFLGHALYASVNLRPSQLDLFPMLASQVISGQKQIESKSLVFLYPLFADRIKSTTNIRAFAVPRIIQSAKSSFRDAPKTDAALAVVQASILEWSFKRMPNAAARFERTSQLINNVPCFWLELGQDLNDIPRCVRAILREVATT